MESLLWGCPGHHPAQRMWRGLLLQSWNWPPTARTAKSNGLPCSAHGFQQGGSLSMLRAAKQPCSPKKGGWRGAGCTDVDGPGTICMFDWRMPYKITSTIEAPLLQSAILWFEAAFLKDSSLTHSTTSISEIYTVCTFMNEQLCSLLWSLQSTSLASLSSPQSW